MISFKENIISIKMLTILLFSLSFSGNLYGKTTIESRPNILFIMSDDHTSQAWGIYDGILKDYVKVDNIKRLASEGAVLDNVFCTNSICSPSRAAILTSQYSHKNKGYTLREPLQDGSKNIAGILRENGYETAVIGKWHLVKEPEGFDHYNVLPGQGVYHNPVLKSKENWQDGYKGGKKYSGFSADVITNLTIDWLSKRKEEKPFLMMTHFKATHEPFDFPQRHKDLYRNVEIPEPESLYDFSPKTTGRTFKGQKLEILGGRMVQATIDPENFWTSYPDLPFSLDGLDSIAARKKIYQKYVKDFMRCGAAIDDNIGRLLDYLEESGLAENTVVIYTADQGYFLGEHGFFDKRLIYEESLRMPFVIRYPKEIKGGTRINDIILNIDFPALMADYAGVEIPDNWQGNSFRNNLMEKTPKDWRNNMYYRYWLHRTERPGHFGIRDERYKLAFFYGQPLGMKGAMKESTIPTWEFFDLKTDPKEIRNAYNNPQYADIIQSMKNELINLRKELGDMDEQSPVMQDIFKKHWN